MGRTTVFKSNRSQAVRLPKAVSLPDDVKHVEIVAVGRTRIITPAGERWDSCLMVRESAMTLCPTGTNRRRKTGMIFDA